MITEKMHRSKGWESFDMGDRNISIQKAIRNAIEFELGYGGRIIKIDNEEKSITIKTNILGCVDTSKFICETKQEYVFLLEACNAHRQFFGMKNDKDLERATKYVMEYTVGNALRVTGMSGPLIGGIVHHKGRLNMIVASFAMISSGMEEVEVVETLKGLDDNKVKEWIEASCI